MNDVRIFGEKIAVGKSVVGILQKFITNLIPYVTRHASLSTATGLFANLRAISPRAAPATDTIAGETSEKAATSSVTMRGLNIVTLLIIAEGGSGRFVTKGEGAGR